MADTSKRPLLRTILWNKKQGFGFLEPYKMFVRLRVDEFDKGGLGFSAVLEVLPINTPADSVPFVLRSGKEVIKWWKDPIETEAICRLLMGLSLDFDTAKVFHVQGCGTVVEIDSYVK